MARFAGRVACDQLRVHVQMPTGRGTRNHIGVLHMFLFFSRGEFCVKSRQR